jgi:hypothetical protein
VRRGEIERVEVVVHRLDLAAVHDPVAEPEEDVLHLPANLSDEMELAPRHGLSRKRHVDLLLGQPPAELLTGQGGLALADRLFEGFPQGVEDAARLGVAHLAESLLQLALSPQVADADVIELGQGGSARNRALRLGFQALDVHRRSVSSSLCPPMTPSLPSTTPGAGA